MDTTVFKTENVAVRMEGEDGNEQPVIEGYAALFNTLSEEMGYYREMIMPGAFRESIGPGNDVHAYVQHQGGLAQIGRTLNNTLTLEEDQRGLKFTVKPPDTSAGRDIVTLIKRGDITQMSFAFKAVDVVWREKEGDEIRELHQVELFEISPVSRAAYSATSVQARNREAIYNEHQAEKEKPENNFQFYQNRHRLLVEANKL